MNMSYDMSHCMDTFRKVTGQAPDQNAIIFIASFCAAADALHKIGEEARRRGVRIDPGEFQRALPRDTHPEIVNALYAALTNPH